jgi:hypothetical protein
MAYKDREAVTLEDTGKRELQSSLSPAFGSAFLIALSHLSLDEASV